MVELLIQGCSSTKRDTEATLPAIDIYDGYFYRIIDKAARMDVLRESIDILILSAKHGILEPDEPIQTYDCRMTTQRANELNEEVVQQIKRKLTSNDYERVWVNLGSDYQEAIDGLPTATNIPVAYFSGRLGKRGRQLKEVIRTDETHSHQTQRIN